MHKRPLLLKLYSLLLLLDPIIRLFFISLESEFPLSQVIMKSIDLGPMDLFNYWLLFPLCGIFILSVKTYAYVGFLSLQLYSLYFHLSYEPYAWPYLSPTPSMTAIAILFINLMFFIYLLLPAPRQLFFDKRLRWWESAARFFVNTVCNIKLNGKELEGKLEDISQSGALISTTQDIPINDDVEITFNLLKRDLTIKGRVVRSIENDENLNKYGVSFHLFSFPEKVKMKLLVFDIARSGLYGQKR
jgi:hypothetical protein